MWGAAAIVALVGLSACSAAASKHTTVVTAIRRYEPFVGRRIAPGVRVARAEFGACSVPSREDRRGDAYKCEVGGLIYDPCFAYNMTGHYVLCPLFDPTAEVLRVKLLVPLPHNSLPARADKPWELETADGRWCKLYVPPPTIRVLGSSVAYDCSPGWLLGTPHRGKTWTATFAPGIGSGSYGRVDLASAWW
jgi:hypothetical protein